MHYPSGLGQTFVIRLFWLFVSTVKTGARRIIRLDELSSVVRFDRTTHNIERRTTEDSSSRRIMRTYVLQVFALEQRMFAQVRPLAGCSKHG